MTPPRAQDVTCGRGKNRWNSAGNVRFKELIASNLDRYRNAPSKGQKSTIVKEIYDVLRRSGARFLKLDEQGSDRWVELGLMQGKTKIAHALRDLSRIRRERGGANGGGVRSACSTNSLEEDENESSCSSSQPTLTTSIHQGLHQEEDHNKDKEDKDHHHDTAAPGVLLSTRKGTASSPTPSPPATSLWDEHDQKEEHRHEHQHHVLSAPRTQREAPVPWVTRRRRNLLQDHQRSSEERHPLLQEVAAHRQPTRRDAVDTAGILGTATTSTSDAEWFLIDEEEQGLASLQDDKHYLQKVDKLNAPFIEPRQEASEEGTQGFMKLLLCTKNVVPSSPAETSTLASLREGLNIMNFPFSPAFDRRRELHDQPPFSCSYFLPPSSHHEQSHQWPGQRFVAPFIEAHNASSPLPRSFFAGVGASAGAVSTHASIGRGTSNSITFSGGDDLLRVGLLGAADSHAAAGRYGPAEPQFAHMAAHSSSAFTQPVPSLLSNNQSNHHMFLTLPPQEQQEPLRFLPPNNYSNSHFSPFAGWGSAPNLFERPFSPLFLLQPATGASSFGEQGQSEESGVRSEEEVQAGHPRHNDHYGDASFPSNGTHFCSR